jgi:hypothetical protein
VVEALRYKPEGRGFDPPMVLLDIFMDIIWPWGRLSPLQIEYQEYFMGVKVAGA